MLSEPIQRWPVLHAERASPGTRSVRSSPFGDQRHRVPDPVRGRLQHDRLLDRRVRRRRDPELDLNRRWAWKVERPGRFRPRDRRLHRRSPSSARPHVADDGWAQQQVQSIPAHHGIRAALVTGVLLRRVRGHVRREVRDLRVLDLLGQEPRPRRDALAPCQWSREPREPQGREPSAPVAARHRLATLLEDPHAPAPAGPVLRAGRRNAARAPGWPRRPDWIRTSPVALSVRRNRHVRASTRRAAPRTGFVAIEPHASSRPAPPARATAVGRSRRIAFWARRRLDRGAEMRPAPGRERGQRDDGGHGHQRQPRPPERPRPRPSDGANDRATRRARSGSARCPRSRSASAPPPRRSSRAPAAPQTSPRPVRGPGAPPHHLHEREHDARLERHRQQRPGGARELRTERALESAGLPWLGFSAQRTPRNSDPEPHSSGRNHSAPIRANRASINARDPGSRRHSQAP